MPTLVIGRGTSSITVVTRQTTLASGRRQVKIRLIAALIGLEISFALPAFAQREDTVAAHLVQELRRLEKKTEEAYKKARQPLAQHFSPRTQFLLTKKGFFPVGRPSRHIMQ